MYLLYERENETALRIAFAGLVQERHHHFHDKDEHTETKFEECGNDICIKALQVLQEARKPRVEINNLSVEIIGDYMLRIEKSQQSCIAYIDKKSVVEKPAPPPDGCVILEA